MPIYDGGRGLVFLPSAIALSGYAISPKGREQKSENLLYGYIFDIAPQKGFVIPCEVSE